MSKYVRRRLDTVEAFQMTPGQFRVRGSWPEWLGRLLVPEGMRDFEQWTVVGIPVGSYDWIVRSEDTSIHVYREVEFEREFKEVAI